MANNEKLNYQALITKVISNFDEIYTSLYKKGVDFYKKGDATIKLVEQGNTAIPTDDYANIINTRLWTVEGGITPNTISSGGHNVIADRTGNNAAQAFTLDYSTGKVTLGTFDTGYFGEGSTIYKTLGTESLKDLTFASFAEVENDSQEVTGYRLSATNDTLIRKVDLGRAHVKVDATISAATGDDAPSLVTSHDLEATANGLQISKGTAIPGGYSFTVKNNATVSGAVKSTLTSNNVTLTNGYLNGANDLEIVNTTDTFNLSGLSVAGAGETTYYIAAGSVKLKSIQTSGATITASGVITNKTKGASVDATNGYAINASVGLPTIKAQTSEGYVKGGEEVDISPAEENWNANAETLYIKKGSISAHTGLTNTPEITAPVGTVSDAAVTGKVNIKVDNSQITVTPVLDEGYIKSADVANTTIPAASKYVNIDYAAGSVNVTGVGIVAQNSNGILSNNNSDYEIDLTATATLASSLTNAGYLDAINKITTNTGASFTDKIYVKRGSITPAGSVVIGAVDADKDATGKPSVPNYTAMFLTDVDDVEGKDYYTIQSKTTYTGEAGYIEALPGETLSSTYYLPRAVLEYVEDSTSGNFIQVKESGYLPSGSLFTSDITGTLDAAVVHTTLTSNDVLVKTSGTGLYAINVEKLTTGSAGYISSTEGTVSGTAYIDHGKVTTNVSCVKGGVSIAKATGTGASGFVFTTNSTTKVKNTLTQGYIKPDLAGDLVVNGSNVASGADFEYEHNHEFAVAEAGLSVVADSLTGSASASRNIEVSTTATDYVITPVLKNADGQAATASVSVTSAGYVDTTFAGTATPIALSTATPLYIKAGVKNNSVNGSGSVTLNSDFTTKKDKYTVSVAPGSEISVEGTLAAGYYGSAAERALSGKATVSGSLEINAASVSITSATADVDLQGQAGLLLHNNIEAANSSNYYQITPTLGAVTLTKTLGEGYFKAADYDDSSVGELTNGSQYTYFIKKYMTAETVAVEGGASGETAYAPFGQTGFGVTTATVEGTQTSVSQDVAYIDVENAYSEKKIEVKLHADACGSNVRNSLAALEARLAGSNVSVVNVA